MRGRSLYLMRDLRIPHFYIDLILLNNLNSHKTDIVRIIFCVHACRIRQQIVKLYVRQPGFQRSGRIIPLNFLSERTIFTG